LSGDFLKGRSIAPLSNLISIGRCYTRSNPAT
jgi:hypothetical protein